MQMADRSETDEIALDRALCVRLATDYPLFARSILRIAPKAGGAPVPLLLNEAQMHLHRLVEQQREGTGRVRALVLKGRQQGISTYTEGRYYHRLSHQRGRRAMILTHEDAATQTLFRMVARFWEHAPSRYRPHLGRANDRELLFDLLDSRYSVATAGARETGRGGTAQFFHGSEVAFWPRASEHLAGIGQIVPDAAGTEMILESTANGTANVFHELWSLAVRGRSEYMPVFIPWFWQREYRCPPPAGGLDLSGDDQEYQAAYGLDTEQMAWRAKKTATDFRGNSGLFDQEYPAAPEVAFASSSPNALIRSALVAAARKARGLDAVGPIIMGVDPAEYGDDQTSVALRQGRVARKLASWGGIGTMETAGKVALLADSLKPSAICVDATGVGTGVADRLREMGYPVTRVHFGQRAIDDERYAICRDEMWGELREWLEDAPCSIEDDDDLAAQLCSVQYTHDSKRRVKLEPKEVMRKRGLRSPDDADALALTFFRGVSSVADDGLAFRARKRYW